jgi:predicted ATP-binding protein involved in virulence
VVLVDELDIHLHPIWQRDIARLLRAQFPKLQFIVATHSPLIAAGAGEDAQTLKFSFAEGRAVVEEVKNVAALRVDAILQSPAFGLVSAYSPQTQEKIDRYDLLLSKKRRTLTEERDMNQLRLFLRDAGPFEGIMRPGSLDERVEKYLEKALQ